MSDAIKPVAWMDPTNRAPSQSVTFDPDVAGMWPHIYKTALYNQSAIDAAVAAERERCAKVCESLFDADDTSCNEAEQCAAAIRQPVDNQGKT